MEACDQISSLKMSNVVRQHHNHHWHHLLTFVLYSLPPVHRHNLI